MSHIHCSLVTLSEDCKEVKLGIDHVGLTRRIDIKESCHTFNGIMSHIQWSHVTYSDDIGRKTVKT